MIVLVSDLRQYTYCPRIVYYHYCLPSVRPTTYKMESGSLAHNQEEDRERRRSLRPYHLNAGQRHFDVWLEDEELRLRGKLDMLVQCPTEVIPVEYKNSPGRLGRHVVMQLAAYGLLVERRFELPAQRGFVYYIPARRAREIVLDEALKDDVRQAVVEIEEMVTKELMPPPPRSRKRCAICEFRLFCNDVL